MNEVTMVIQKMFGVYAVLIAIMGTIGNSLCFAVCMNKSLRESPTFLIMAYLSIVDTISLYLWNLSIFSKVYFGVLLQEINNDWCRVVTFCQFFSLESSAFLLVAMTVDRYLSVKFTLWRKVYFKLKATIVSCSLIVTFFFGLNFHLLFDLYSNVNQNGTVVDSCLSTPMYKLWRTKHTYLSSFVPFGIILIVNLFLIYEMVKFQRNKIASGNSEARKTMTVSVAVLTFCFVLFTGPIAFFGIYFRDYLFSPNGETVLAFLNALSFTYHGSNFIIFKISNKRFSNVAIEMFTKKGSSKQRPAVSTTGTKPKNISTDIIH